jgi:hypothetical protein
MNANARAGNVRSPHRSQLNCYPLFLARPDGLNSPS